jgi:hypothetical protein
MQRKFLIATILLTLLVGIGYWGFDQLGGNDPVTIELIQKKPDTLLGKTFIGIPQDEKLANVFKEIQTQKSLKTGTYLHTIYETEPAGKLDTMKVFVGINQVLPEEGFEFKRFEEEQYLLAKIKGSSWVMPSPNTIKSELKKYAAQHNLKLTGVFIDKIIRGDEVHVIAPIAKVD